MFFVASSLFAPYLFAENWPGYEGTLHQNSSAIDISGSLQLNWEKRFAYKSLGSSYDASYSSTGMTSRNIVIYNGMLAVANTIDPTPISRTTYVTLLDYSTGTVITSINSTQMCGPRRDQMYNNDNYMEAYDTGIGFSVLAWDPTTEILFMMNGGDGTTQTAYKILNSAGSFVYGEPWYVSYASLSAWKDIYDNYPLLQDSTGLTRDDLTTPAVKETPLRDTMLMTDHWDYRTTSNATGFFDVSISGSHIAESSRSGHTTCGGLHIINKYTGLRAYENGGGPSALTRPFKMWGGIISDGDKVYYVGASNDVDADGEIGNDEGYSPTATEVFDQGFAIVGANIVYVDSYTNGGYAGIGYKEKANVSTLFGYKYDSSYLDATHPSSCENHESYLEIDAFHRNKAILVQGDGAWAAWKPNQAGNVQLIHASPTVNETYDIGIGAGRRGQDIWPNMSYISTGGKEYIVYYGANAYYRQFTGGGFANNWSATIGNPLGPAELSVFSITDEAVKWTYELNNVTQTGNYPSLPPNEATGYFERSRMVVSGSKAYVAWVDLSGTNAILKVAGFDITSSAAPVTPPVAFSYDLGILSANNSKTCVIDLVAVDGRIFALVVESNNLLSTDHVWTAERVVCIAGDSVVDGTVPNAPTNLTNPGKTNTSLTLDWTASAQAGDGDYASYYRVHRNSVLISTASGTSYTDSGLSAGTTYSYGIYAVDDSNNISVSSASGNFYTSGIASDVTAPNAPTNLTNPSKTQTTLLLVWTASTQAGDGDYASYYRVYRNAVLISTAIGTSYNDSGLTAGTTYNYGIYAVDDATLVSVSSATGRFYTSVSLADSTVPNAPTNLNSSNQTETSIELSWTASAQAGDGDYASYYKILRESVQISTTADTSYTDSGLSAGTTYNYAVYAVDDSSNVSATAASGSFSTQQSGSDTTAPTIVSVTAVSSVSISVEFSEPVNETTAETISNFSINNSITIVAAVLGPSQRIVTLAASQHSAGITYTITINNIQDKAGTPNTITANSQMSYAYGDATPPSEVTGTKGVDRPTDKGDSVIVSWTKINDADVAGYKIYYAYTQFSSTAQATYFNGSPLSNSSISSITVTGLNSANEYYFAVAAVDLSGNISSVITSTGPVKLINNQIAAGNYEIGSGYDAKTKVVISPGTNIGVYIDIAAPGADKAAGIYAANNAAANDTKIITETVSELSGTCTEFKAKLSLLSEVTIIIPYPASVTGETENGLNIYCLNETTNRWELVSGNQTIDKVNKTVSAATSHFSVFRILGTVLSADTLNEVRVYPNPFKPNDKKPETGTWDTGIIFDNLTNNSTIEIYSLSGELVTTLEETDNNGKYQWDVRNKENEKLSSGTYLYRITDSSGEKMSGKIAIVR
ncbi:MAG: hypothetical protein A2252_00335 [Elusimicrobia bacterium RIFOXYA2_FULL_39_19]|nr:MAG: hypothetical protein A2252_00335 [Elusimicrobia bacterium RIFOXYA2_FULL_39_19]